MKRVLSIFSCLGVIASVVSYSSSVLALEAQEVYDRAKGFTVQINGADWGTGTIIAHDNGTYTVLTCKHVVEETGSYQITTLRDTYPVASIEKGITPNADLAIITFKSSNTYPVARLGDSEKAVPGLDIHVVGYNAPFYELTKREYLPDTGKVRVRQETREKGYDIVHTVAVPPGHSGGGIFDNEARLIGVNGEVFSEPETGKAFGKGIPIPSEIYLAARNSLETSHNNTNTSANSVSEENEKRQQQDYWETIVKLDKVLAANPEDVDSLYDRSRANYHLQNFDAVIRDLDRIIDLDPQNIEAYNLRGTSYGQLKDYEDAFADLDQAIRLNPQFAKAYSNRGATYYRLNDYQNAIADLDQAIRLDPQLANAYNIRGHSYHRLWNYESAIADLSEAIRLDPQLASAYYERGFIYKNLNNRFAIRDFKEAAKLYQQQGNDSMYCKAIDMIDVLSY